MSSQFTVAEIELARLGLAALSRRDLDVRRRRPRAWLHRAGCARELRRAILDRGRCTGRGDRNGTSRGLLPLGKQLTGDPRCRLFNGDFFALSHSHGRLRCRRAPPLLRCGAGGTSITRRGILLHPSHGALYQPEGIARLARHLHPGGVFRALVE